VNFFKSAEIKRKLPCHKGKRHYFTMGLGQALPFEKCMDLLKKNPEKIQNFSPWISTLDKECKEIQKSTDFINLFEYEVVPLVTGRRIRCVMPEGILDFPEILPQLVSRKEEPIPSVTRQELEHENKSIENPGKPALVAVTSKKDEECKALATINTKEDFCSEASYLLHLRSYIESLREKIAEVLSIHKSNEKAAKPDRSKNQFQNSDSGDKGVNKLRALKKNLLDFVKELDVTLFDWSIRQNPGQIE